MMVARIDVKTTNPNNGSQGTTRLAAKIARAEHRKQKDMTARALQFASLRPVVGPAIRAAEAVVRAHGRPRVTITRISRGRMDSDGIAAATKYIRDGIAAFFATDDNDLNFEWVYRGKTGRPREYAVEISID